MRQPRKGEKGAVNAYISRNQALKKLQLSLSDFRRLCILKGIYPHEPRHRKKVNKGSSEPRTFYLLKDIQFLAHEPIINSFRQFKIFVRRLKRAVAKENTSEIKSLRHCKPKYRLDHIVKERYPNVIDAVRDLDDCLSMCFLFATFPKTNRTYLELIHRCRRLTIEFMHYVIASHSLKKVFLSIKGIYFQVNIMGEDVHWIVPHNRGFEPPTDVDFRIMQTFVEFYSTMLGFLNFRLFTSIGFIYPPKVQNMDPELEREDLLEHLAGLGLSLESNIVEPAHPLPDKFDNDGKEKDELDANLFAKFTFFLNREVPREVVAFLIRCCNGKVSWDSSLAAGATFDESDPSITHQIVDRNVDEESRRIDRLYVQPQWVFDCINNSRILNTGPYLPGLVPPPHLSPFVDESESAYKTPDYVLFQPRVTDDIVEEFAKERGIFSEEAEEKPSAKRELEDDSDEDIVKQSLPKKKKMNTVGVVSSGVTELRRKAPKRANTESVESIETKEEKKLREMMIPKKHKRLYHKIMFSKKKRAQEAMKLEEKRVLIDAKKVGKK